MEVEELGGVDGGAVNAVDGDADAAEVGLAGHELVEAAAHDADAIGRRGGGGGIVRATCQLTKKKGVDLRWPNSNEVAKPN